MSDRATSVLGGGGKKSEKKPEKKISHIVVKKSHNGDHIHEHHHTHPDHHPSETHTTRGDDEMIQHLLSNIGTANEGEQPPADPGADAGGQPPAAGVPQVPPQGAM